MTSTQPRVSKLGVRQRATRIENWPIEKLRSMHALSMRPKNELVRFCSAFIGGSWWYLRTQNTKGDLIHKIAQWACKQKGGKS